MADTWNHKTIITPDDALYIDGELIVKGNIVQIETTQIVNRLESNTLIINSDGSQGDDGRYAIPQLALKYNHASKIWPDDDGPYGWGLMYYRADDTNNADDAGLGYMRFETMGYPVNGAIQIQKIHTMPPDNTASSSNIAILEGNAWSGTACAAYAMTSAVTFEVQSADNNGYKDIVPVSDSFINANDTVILNLNLDATGVTPDIYGADTGTTNRIDVDAKGRITNVVNRPIEITFDQVTGGNITANVSNVVYDIFSAGTGLSYTGSAGTPQGEYYISDTTVTAGNYGQADSTVNFTVNAQGQLTQSNNVLIDILSSQISDFESAVETLFTVSTVTDGTSWTASDLIYNSGVFTYTTPTRSEIRNTISASGDLNYDNVTGIISLNNTLAQDLTFTGLVDLSGATVPGFTITGNLDVLGNLNAVAKEDLYVRDSNIYMNVGNAVQDSHIVIDRSSVPGPDSFIRWDSTAKQWSHNDGINEWILVRDTDDIAEGTANLWYTSERANADTTNLLVAGDGIEFQTVSTPSNPAALSILADLGTDLIFDVSGQIDIATNVVTTDRNFDITSQYDFTNGTLIIPEGTQSINGYIYTDIASTEAFIHLNGVNIPITPSVDFGRVDNGEGVIASGAIEVYAGTVINPIGPANANIAIMRGLKGGANVTITYDTDPATQGNVILIDSEGLNTQGVRSAFTATNNGGFGSLNYTELTGNFDYTGVSIQEIRNQISGIGLIGYDGSTGEISTSADNYSDWKFVTDNGIGQQETVNSQDSVTFAGGSGISVVNTGKVVTIVNTNTSSDITEVIAGSGLGGGGTSGSVTINVGAGTGISVAADTVSVSGLTVAEFSGAAIQTSLEGFVNSDTVLMTAAAVDARIQTYGSGTVSSVDTTGTVNGITLTGGPITSSGTITLGGTLGGIVLSQLSPAAILTSGESFLDTDTAVLTAAATDDRILSYGYTTNIGDITGVGAGAGLTGGGNSGSVTLNIGAGTGVTVNANDVEIGQDVATTADVSFGSVTTTELTTGSNSTPGTITGDWSLTAGSTLTSTYADLAERYVADKYYQPGTVLVIGGEAEVTACHSFMDIRVAGIISANPAFAMNEDLTEGTMIALKGRVPVKVSGEVRKGDLLVTAEEVGCATSAQTDNVPPTAVIGIALKDSEMGWTEVKV